MVRAKAPATRFRFGAIQITAGQIQGGRRRQEDRWVVQHVDTPSGPRTVAAVFDGVGGHANGAQAAQAAADHLPDLVESGVRDRRLLKALEPHVQATGGACTATVALLDDRITLLGLGDSMAYDRRGPILPHDRHPDGRLRGWLGGRPKGHRQRRTWQDAPIALCTDGVDGILGPLHPGTGPDWVEDQLAAVTAKGAPDNATLLLIEKV